MAKSKVEVTITLPPSMANTVRRISHLLGITPEEFIVAVMGKKMSKAKGKKSK